MREIKFRAWINTSDGCYFVDTDGKINKPN